MNHGESEFQIFLDEQLQNKEFRKHWEKILPEMNTIRAASDTIQFVTMNKNDNYDDAF